MVGHGAGLAMFFGVLGWRSSNTVNYIGEEKIEDLIHG